MRTLKSSAGQSAVEYILLLSVVVSLGFAVFNSSRFKNLFGKDSSFFDILRKRMEYTYRFCNDGKEDMIGTTFGINHPSYVMGGGGSTRFFFPKSKYP